MSAAAFVDEMLAVIRREFFAGKTDRQFFQERNALLQAVTYPADWLNRKGAKLPASKYRAILQTVIDTIKARGCGRYERFSVYFLHAVQRHMLHQGDKYYRAAKELRPAASVVPKIVGKVRVSNIEADVIETLMEVRRALRSKGGRKKQLSDYVRYGTLDLFGVGQSVRPQRRGS